MHGSALSPRAQPGSLLTHRTLGQWTQASSQGRFPSWPGSRCSGSSASASGARTWSMGWGGQCAPSEFLHPARGRVVPVTEISAFSGHAAVCDLPAAALIPQGPIPWLTHTHTHTHTLIHSTHTYTHSHTLTHTHSLSLSLSHTHTHTHTHTHGFEPEGWPPEGGLPAAPARSGRPGPLNLHLQTIDPRLGAAGEGMSGKGA